MRATRIGTFVLVALTSGCVTGLLGGGGPNLLGSWNAESFVVSVPGFPTPLNMTEQGGTVTVTFSGSEDGGTYVAQSSVEGIDPTTSGTWSLDGDKLTMDGVPGMTECSFASSDDDEVTVSCPRVSGEPYVLELVLRRAG